MNAAANIIDRIGGLPSSRDEHWQYAPLRALRSVQDWRPAPARQAATLAVPAATAGYEQIVFIDGHLAGGALADSVHALTAPVAPAGDPDLRLASLAAAAGLPALALELGGTRRVELCFISTGASGCVYPRLHLQLAANAEVTLLERHSGAAAAQGFSCTDFQLRLAAASRLVHYRLHGLAGDGLCYDQLQVQQAAGSQYIAQHIAANDGATRTTALIELAGRAARCEWHSAMNLQAGQSADLLLRVRHQAPATESLSRFRGIASGQARASCAADVLVDATARGARVQQSLQGLNEGAGAGVNLRPRLTIDTDDIQAQHGATVGQLDAQLLFYMRSRGLDLETATRLLKWAFLGDVLSRIRDPEVRQSAEALTAGGLAP